jgi:hypothetical protein
MSKYSQEEIDSYKEYFPNYTEQDIVDMLNAAELQAGLAAYEVKYNL